jgi:low affinity Fe/Cu permease
MATQNHHRPQQQSAFDRIGCLVSSWVADIAATPVAQILVILVCALWFAFGFADALLTAVLSILAITLTQMVLNQQKAREAEAHRRDVAMHAKLDELLIAMKGARDEMAGIEELDEEDIEELKEEVKESIEKAGAAAGGEHERHAAKRAAEAAVESAKAKKSRRSAKSGR